MRALSLVMRIDDCYVERAADSTEMTGNALMNGISSKGCRFSSLLSFCGIISLRRPDGGHCKQLHQKQLR